MSLLVDGLQRLIINCIRKEICGILHLSFSLLLSDYFLPRHGIVTRYRVQVGWRSTYNQRIKMFRTHFGARLRDQRQQEAN